MKLFFTEDFDAISSAAWKQKIQFELDGADYQSLISSTPEGINIKPFYHLDEFEKLIIPENENGFKICQEIEVSSETEANKNAIQAINGGVNSLKFNIPKPLDLAQLFKGLLGRNIAFHFEFKFLYLPFITELDLYLKNEVVYLNIDCIGQLARHGNWFK